jgi:hypothetical protein
MPCPRTYLLATCLTATTLAHAGGHTLSNARLSVTLADPGTGYTANNADRVDAISWTASDGGVRSNYVAVGGPLHCGDPQESFGQSYGEPEGTTPLFVYAGLVSTWKGNKPTKGKTATHATGNCADYGPPSELARTSYKLSNANAQINELQVSRTFEFNAGTPVYSGHGVRAYVPRVPLAAYRYVLALNAAGTTLQTFDSAGCGGDCELTDWNGRWFADDDGNGNGLLVVRSKSSTAPALLAINNDSFSASNLTSVVLLQPEGGWKAPVTETEYLCFYDLTSWPAASRTAGRLPKGCAGTLP